MAVKGTQARRHEGTEGLPDGYTKSPRRDLRRICAAGKRRPEARRAAEEGEMNPAQFEFISAIEAYKKINRVSFLKWSEVLALLGRLGYRKVMVRDFELGCPEPELSVRPGA
jgi:hypothetical protein